MAEKSVTGNRDEDAQLTEAAKGTSNPPHPSAVGGAGPAKFVNPNTKPTTPGNYGAPISNTILK
jgi:hypothetical protein